MLCVYEELPEKNRLLQIILLNKKCQIFFFFFL